MGASKLKSLSSKEQNAAPDEIIEPVILDDDSPIPSMVTTTPLASTSVRQAAVEAGLIRDYQDAITDEVDSDSLVDHLSSNFNVHFSQESLSSDEHFDAFAEEDDDLPDGMHIVSDEDLGDDLGYQDIPESKKTNSTAMVRVSSQGNIGAFIRAANQVPMLKEDEEITLARRLRDFGDLDAARKLVMSHLRLVVSVARGYTGYGLPLSDLIQEGNIGLMKAVKSFQPDKGGRLAAFAVHYIRSEITEYVIRNWRIVKVATTKAQRKLFFNMRHLKSKLGWMSNSEKEDLAMLLGVNITDVSEMEKRMSGSDIGFDLDEDDSDKGVAVKLSPSAYLEDENSNFAIAYESYDYSNWQNSKLCEALQSLDERARYILKRRWLDEEKATLQELSRELKVSIERVRQLESNALNKLKTILSNEGVSEDGEVKALPKESKSTALVAKKRGRKPKARPQEIETEAKLSAAASVSTSASAVAASSAVAAPSAVAAALTAASASSATTTSPAALPKITK